MSTGTSHQSTAAQPVPTGHRTALIVTIVAALSVVATLWLVYVSMEANGADLSDRRGWVLIVIVSTVPGLLVALAAALTLGSRGRGRPTLAQLAPVGVLLMMAMVTGMAALGGRAYDATHATISAACTSEKIAVLEQFRTYGPESTTPSGNEDGTCSAGLIYPGEDAQSTMATLVGAATADGWTTSSAEWDHKTLTRNGQTVLVTHAWTEEGQTGIRITVVDR